MSGSLNWELAWMHTAVTLVAASTVFYLIYLFKPDNRAMRAGGWGCILLSMICLCVSLYVRSGKAEYFALSNMYESLMVVSIGIQLVFLVADRWFSNTIKALGFPVALLILGALLFDLTLPTDIKPLQPALQSYWRSIHVPIILLSYALFTVSFLASVVQLIKSGLEDSKKDGAGKQPKNGQTQPATANGAPLQTSAFDALAIAEAIEQDKASVYDEITYRCVAFGFPMLMLGIILGGLWANEAWGNYWSWDPKESMSLVTLVAYGVYLHLRVNGEHSPKTLAWVSVVGFVLMLVTYFGVNLMGVGLHSYGKIG